MKRKHIGEIIGLSLLLLFMILSRGFTVRAEEMSETSKTFISGEYQYSILENGTVSIVKYTGTHSIVRIPELIDGKKVTVIGNGAFLGNESINTVYFSNSIRQVIGVAFTNCSNLHNIYLNFGLEYIGQGAFAGCDLYNIEIPSTVNEIEQLAFARNKKIKSITIPEGVQEIGAFVFLGCTELKCINLGQNVTAFIKGSFDNCIKLKEITTNKIPEYNSDYFIIPNQISTLFGENFEDCNDIKKIVVMNKDCRLDEDCLPKEAVIYGYKNSTAQKYAEDSGKTFIEFYKTEKIKLNKTIVNLKIGGVENERLAISYTPSNTTIKEVVWSSSNPKVATVDQSGNVKALSNGTATISARTFDESNLKQECKVTVTTALKNINLSSKKVVLNLSNKKTADLKVSSVPAQACYGRVSWKSSNTKVVTVNSNGKLTAKGTGKATVTATTSGKTQSCTVYVAPKQVEKLKVSNEKNNSLTLSWTKTAGSSGYKIYAYDEKSKSYIHLKNCSKTVTSYTVKSINGKKLTSARKYKFRICPYITIDKEKIKGAYSYTDGYTKPNKTSITSLKRKKSGTSMTVKWKRVNEAAYYEVWISKYKNKGYKCVKETKSNSCTIKKLSKRKKYYVKIRGIVEVNGRKIEADYSNIKGC